MIVQFPTHDEHRPAYRPALSPRDRLALDKSRATVTLERLRYRAYARSGVLAWSLMQRLGDFGRKYIPGLAGLRIGSQRWMP